MVLLEHWKLYDYNMIIINHLQMNKISTLNNLWGVDMPLNLTTVYQYCIALY